jgi:GH15 family glucan-1,4-alpha-glucosidase
MLSATIDAMEECDVATVDIPGAFMQANIDEVVHVKFEGKIAEMLVRMDPKMYRRYIKDKNGKTVLYVVLFKFVPTDNGKTGSYHHFLSCSPSTVRRVLTQFGLDAHG